MNEPAIQAKLEAAIPGATVQVLDMKGTGDHFQVSVIAEAFVGKSLIEQHQMINQALKEELKGPIHALKINTSTP